MKLTKYEHAFLVLEEQNQKLVIDPGSYSPEIPELENVCGIVITHVHGDHFDLSNIDKILARNPEAIIYTVEEVAKELGARAHKVVSGGASEQCGPFQLAFHGEKHAIIHDSAPVWQNVGVIVNQALYYPGDSFTIPDAPVEVLAVPAGSPWAKIGEEMDFVETVKPAKVFPTHNAHLSEIGLGGRDNWLGLICEKIGAQYIFLKPGESLEL